MSDPHQPAAHPVVRIFDFSDNGLAVHRAWTVSRWVTPLLGKSAPEIADLAVMSLGLSGEIAEVAEVVENWACSGEYDKAQLIKELGDVFYYWSRVSAELCGPTPQRAHRLVIQAPDRPLTAPVLDALRLVRAGGSVSELMKKFIRDGHLDQDAARIRLEEVFIAWHALCTASGLAAEQVVNMNYEKVEGRAHRGTIRGSGDNR